MALSVVMAVMGVAVGTTAGCSHPPPPAATPATAASTPPGEPPPPPPCAVPEPLRVSLSASPRLNPGEKGEALATVIRLYQLKGVGKLMGVSFDDLLDHDKDTLADDLISVQEVTLNPGEKLDPPAVRKPDSNFLLAVALFRQPAGTTWKASKRLNPPDPQYCHTANNGAHPGDGAVRLYLDENRIELR
jgi:type VI secretion system protein VasD